MKRVVVIGGGFAGSLAAKKLENWFKVVLIDSKDYFEYTPGILRVITEPFRAGKLQVKHKDYLKKTKIIVRKVKSADRNFVVVRGRKISFDYLVICSGSRYNLQIKEDNILLAIRVRHLFNAFEKLKKAKSVLIIGGGLVGVELAGEIIGKFKDKTVLIVQSDKHLIPRNDVKTINYAENFLIRRGVKLLLGRKIVNFSNGVFISDGGEEIKADMVCMCVGIKPNFEFMKKNFYNVLNEKGQIIVDEYLRVRGERNIFAAGDVTDIVEEKTAQNAEEHTKVIVRNIKALEFGRELGRYVSKKRITMISLGKYNGILEYGSFVLTGKIPALMKWLIEKWVMWQH